MESISFHVPKETHILAEAPREAEGQIGIPGAGNGGRITVTAVISL